VSYRGARAIKLKLTGEPVDADRIRAVREARADVVLRVDANQGFTRTSLEALMPVMEEAEIELIEQPFPVGQEEILDGFRSPIPIAADETVQSLIDMAPAFLLGQLCDIVELDGPLTLKLDRPVRVRHVDGLIECPQEIWGAP